ncbi:MAG: sensor histidine kinase, partial [Chitinophagaceae bacterium]
TLEEIPTLEEWYLRTQPNPDIRATLFAHWLETVEAYKKNQFTEAPYIETDIRCKNKTTRTFNFLFSIHQDIVYILFVDITERKKAEKELISSHFQLRELTSHLQKVREEERKFIAREIHDELGQLITGLKMDISMLKKRLISKIPDVGNYMVDVLELTDTIVQTVRRIASDLRPGILDDVGLGAALEWQAKEFEKRTNIKCVFDNGIENLDLSVDIKSNIFRIYQESLTNIIRHSNATIVKSAAHVIQKKLVLTIVDNGRGFDTNVANKTLGILGMKERAIMINATFTIESKTDAGTAITLKMPLN